MLWHLLERKGGSRTENTAEPGLVLLLSPYEELHYEGLGTYLSSLSWVFLFPVTESSQGARGEMSQSRGLGREGAMDSCQ